MKISGRNQIPGIVRDIEFGDVVSSVTIEYECGTITSIITTASARELRLRPGVCVSALIKSTDVMIIRE
ncbi:molybdopterin-binding protein [Sporomusa sp. KB1]|uniref:TOBE domain-containing protein n=1 Tax=Sporomusa sp. KB1 TaxID=943346 RepID=UPI0011A7A662|nr:TOBE domain-containing protein [Sporomusa sp. KB1]TWH47473.1 molybdate transport system regulatory protein [Sporomusa sp. KB1]